MIIEGPGIAKERAEIQKLTGRVFPFKFKSSFGCIPLSIVLCFFLNVVLFQQSWTSSYGSNAQSGRWELSESYGQKCLLSTGSCRLNPPSLVTNYQRIEALLRAPCSDGKSVYRSADSVTMQ